MKESQKLSGTIGIIVAIEEEKQAFLEVFGNPDIIYDDAPSYEISTWLNMGRCRIYLLCSGYGEIAAAAATQYLIDEYRVDCIINYGAVGGLCEDYSAQKVGFVKKIVHYGFDLSAGGYPVGRYPNQESLFIFPKEEALSRESLGGLLEFTCASADKFVGPGEPKRELRKEFWADICEMESAGIVITCNRNHVPCSFIKAVSDGVDEGGEAFEQNVTSAAKVCVEVIARFIL